MFHFKTMCGVEPVTVVLKMIYELLGDINLSKKDEEKTESSTVWEKI